MYRIKVNFIVLICFSFLGCRKNESGSGGKAKISGYVEFTGKIGSINVTNARVYRSTVVYIKYGATSFPGIDELLYDGQQNVDTLGNFSFGSMFEGNYYLYARGFYTDSNDSTYLVTGGIQVNITNRKANLNYDIAVTP
jgi:hypothetical protein